MLDLAVDSECRASLDLAFCAVTDVDSERWRKESISYFAARAATVQRILRF